MKLSCITVILMLFCYSGSIISQETNRFVKATNPRVAIKDGEEGITKYWNHLEKSKFPIVYDLAKNQAARQVTFYTDVDSILFNVTSNAAYQFNVILNQKDTIPVILSTYTTSYSRLNNVNNNVDSFKFSVNENKQIILRGSINNSAEIDFVFDLGARMTFLIGNNLADKNHLILDGHMEDESSSGLSTEKISSKNTLKYGNIKVDSTPICYIEESGFLENGGGLIGFNIFQGKILEIDFDLQLLIIHDSLPEKIKGYSPIPFKQTTGGLYIPVTINNGAKESAGWYFFDTGADNELTFDYKFALKEKLNNTMKKIGSAVIGSNGNSLINAMVVEVPRVEIGNFIIENVPALLPEESNAEAVIEDGVIGIGLQKRFNMIIDFPNNVMYLKSNKYYNNTFKKKDETNSDMIIGFSIATVLLVLFVFYKSSRKNNRVLM